jgi:membrane protein
MDWLTRIPKLGPVIARLMKTHAWRTWAHYSDVDGDRLAGAATYVGFLSLFPLLAVFAAVTAALLSDDQVNRVEDKVVEQLPFFSDRIDLEGLVQHAGTIGVVSGVLLVWSGLGWVDTLRGCIRGIWECPRDTEDFFVRKAKDVLVLVGLAGVLAASVGGSALATALVSRVAQELGIAENSAGTVLLRVAGFCVGIAADFLFVTYMLRWLPQLHPGRRPLVQAALIGAVGFELLKVLISGYLSGVAGKSMYGAFGTPVALLLWINFMMRLLLLCASWTATAGERRKAVAAAPGPSGEVPLSKEGSKEGRPSDGSRPAEDGSPVKGAPPVKEGPPPQEGGKSAPPPRRPATDDRRGHPGSGRAARAV